MEEEAPGQVVNIFRWESVKIQKQKKRILQMKLVGAMLAVPSVQKKMKGQMNQYIIGPYQKVVEQAKEIGK